ncbi:hypothetical protein [Clostridium hominis]|nr:hypothetical protein [Clostridium hominis]MDU2673386.1 hypothetical protein [Clostridium sp.]
MFNFVEEKYDLLSDKYSTSLKINMPSAEKYSANLKINISLRER